jgi:phytoene dehydrogenase-like protein
VTVYTICPDTLSEGDWEEQNEEFADKLIDYATERMPGLREPILTCEILAPTT